MCRYDNATCKQAYAGNYSRTGLSDINVAWQLLRSDLRLGYARTGILSVNELRYRRHRVDYFPCTRSCAIIAATRDH